MVPARKLSVKDIMDAIKIYHEVILGRKIDDKEARTSAEYLKREIDYLGFSAYYLLSESKSIKLRIHTDALVKDTAEGWGVYIDIFNADASKEEQKETSRLKKKIEKTLIEEGFPVLKIADF